MPLGPDHQSQLRQAAISYVNAVAEASGGTISRDQLEAFTFGGEQVKLIDTSRGIRNPRQLDAALSIMSSPDGPYADELGSDGFHRYKIRTGDWAGGDNRKLHAAHANGEPLIWLQKIRDRVFAPIAPVYLVDEEPHSAQYVLAIGQDLRLIASSETSAIEARAYLLTEAKRRLHRPVFRARVIDAYAQSCAVCSLRHVELLDAAHITPDSDPDGAPVTSNGLALCKIHHSAYDSNVIGIDPELKVHVPLRILEEVDGPMLQHGLKAFHLAPLRVLPQRRADRPDPDRLRRRFEAFLEAS